MLYRCEYTELKDVNTLVPNPNNPNEHPKEQIERLALIIERQGQRSPIVISKRSGFIIKGHGRVLAMKKLGWDKVAVDLQDYEDEDLEYADMVADNEIAKWAVLNLSSVNGKLPEMGPELDIDLLGIKDFKLEPAEKFDKPKMLKKCPKCEHEF